MKANVRVRRKRYRVVLRKYRCSLALLSPKNGINILSLTHVHTTALDKARARTIRLDRPPGEKGNGSHAADDAAGTITLHLVLGKTAGVAASSALSVVLLALGAHHKPVGASAGVTRRTSRPDERSMRIESGVSVRTNTSETRVDSGAKDKVASGTALRQTYLRDLTRSVAAAPVEQAMKVIVDVDMVGMTLDGAGFQCAVVCRARSRRKLYTNVCGLDTLAAAEGARSLIRGQ